MNCEPSKKYPHFRQTNVRAWVWIFIVILSAVGAVLALINGNILLLIDNIAFGTGAYWIDQLEKELTRRNIEDKKVYTL